MISMIALDEREVEALKFADDMIQSMRDDAADSVSRSKLQEDKVIFTKLSMACSVLSKVTSVFENDIKIQKETHPEASSQRELNTDVYTKQGSIYKKTYEKEQ